MFYERWYAGHLPGYISNRRYTAVIYSICFAVVLVIVIVIVVDRWLVSLSASRKQTVFFWTCTRRSAQASFSNKFMRESHRFLNLI